jgi:hypothetical protein
MVVMRDEIEGARINQATNDQYNKVRELEQ